MKRAADFYKYIILNSNFRYEITQESETRYRFDEFFLPGLPPMESWAKSWMIFERHPDGEIYNVISIDIVLRNCELLREEATMRVLDNHKTKTLLMKPEDAMELLGL